MCDATDSGIADTYKEIRTNGSETSWMVLGYDGASKVVLQQKGTGALSDAFVHLANDQAHFIYGRVTTGDEESKRTKFVFISWAGPSLSALKRAKLSVHKASVKSVVASFAVEIHAESMEELSDDIILTKVKKAGGADYSGNTSKN